MTHTFDDFYATVRRVGLEELDVFLEHLENIRAIINDEGYHPDTYEYFGADFIPFLDDIEAVEVLGEEQHGFESGRVFRFQDKFYSYHGYWDSWNGLTFQTEDLEEVYLTPVIVYMYTPVGNNAPDELTKLLQSHQAKSTIMETRES